MLERAILVQVGVGETAEQLLELFPFGLALSADEEKRQPQERCQAGQSWECAHTLASRQASVRHTPRLIPAREIVHLFAPKIAVVTCSAGIL